MRLKSPPVLMCHIHVRAVTAFPSTRLVRDLPISAALPSSKGSVRGQILRAVP